MTTKKYEKPPITPDVDLHQLEKLQDAENGDLSYLQKELRRMMLGTKKLSELRAVHLWDMVVGGYTVEQIMLAFATPGSPLTILLAGFSGKTGVRRFMREIHEAQEKLAQIDASKVRREAYINDRRRLRDAVWAALGRVEPQHSKALLELLDKVQQDIAEAHGVLVKGPGRHPGRRPAGSAVLHNGEQVDKEAPEEGDPEAALQDWGEEEEFEVDDSEDQPEDKE